MKFNPAFLLVFLTLTLAFTQSAHAVVRVGVKLGDWVEYDVSYTGSPPPEHDVVWARMDVMGVEEQRVNATFVSRLANGTVLTVEEDLDFTTGKLIDMFIIPSRLNSGDTFYAQGVGEITIINVEVRAAAGASRTVAHAEAEDTQWYWDRETGVVVEARTASIVYTLDTVAISTNLWSPQILGLNQSVFYTVVAILATVIVATAIIVMAHKKRNNALFH